MSENRTSIQDVLDALKKLINDLPAEITAYVPDSPNVPAIAIYMESWPFAFTEPATFVMWCMVGTTDMQNAQSTLMGWLSDEGDTSIVQLIDENNTLSGVVSSVLPLEVRNFGLSAVQEGRPRLLQAELVLNVLR